MPVHEDCQLAAGALCQWLSRPQLLAILMELDLCRNTHRQKSTVMNSLAAARNGIALVRFEVAAAQQPWYTTSALASFAHSNSTNVHNATQCFILTSCMCAKQTEGSRGGAARGQLSSELQRWRPAVFRKKENGGHDD